MNYIIDIPEDMTKGSFRVLIDNPKATGGIYYKIVKAEPYTEPDREAIENEVWEFVRKVEGLTKGEAEGCFHVEYDSIQFIAKMFTYQEAKAKYEEWKAEKEKIHVGDEVEYTACDETVRFIVTEIDYKMICGFKYPCDNYDDIGEYCEIDMLTKTGRSFPELAELLKKMEGEP